MVTIVAREKSHTLETVGLGHAKKSVMQKNFFRSEESSKIDEI
jgi:hypothetical protein